MNRATYLCQSFSHAYHHRLTCSISLLSRWICLQLRVLFLTDGFWFGIAVTAPGFFGGSRFVSGCLRVVGLVQVVACLSASLIIILSLHIFHKMTNSICKNDMGSDRTFAFVFFHTRRSSSSDDASSSSSDADCSERWSVSASSPESVLSISSSGSIP